MTAPPSAHHHDLVAKWQSEAVRVGGFGALRVGLDFLRDPIRAIERCHARFGDAIALTVRGPGGRVRQTLILGPRYNREVLTNVGQVRPAGLLRVPGPPGSAQAEMRFSYLATSGPEHAGLVKAVAPHFSRDRAAGHFDAIRGVVADDVARWPAHERVDLYSLVMKLGQHAALGLLFGEPNRCKAELFGDQLAEYHDANWKLGARVRIDLPGLPYADVLRRADRLRDFVRGWVTERQGCPADQDLRAAFAAHRSLTGEPLTAERMTAHLNLLGFAAYETIASSLTWTLLLLALHPESLHRLFDELAAAPAVETIDWATLDRLPVLDGVIKESLRLIPPTPLLTWRTIKRRPVEGTKAKIGVVLNPHLTHRQPDPFVDPLRFDPSRWSTIDPTPYQYLPFGAGPRRCPGYWFASEMMKTALAAFVPRWRLVVPPGTRIDRIYHGITMPKRGIPVSLLPQDRRFTSVPVRGNIRDLVAL